MGESIDVCSLRVKGGTEIKEKLPIAKLHRVSNY